MRSRRGTAWSLLAAAGIATAALLAAGPASAATFENGRFVIACDFSHESRNDPIALPRIRGKSHLHHFFGNRSTNSRSTPKKLRRRRATTCTAEDRSAYWVPALSIDGAVIRPDELRAYYASAKKNPRTIQAPPRNLRVIAGEASTVTAQPAMVTNWSCANPLPALFFQVGYPDCGNNMYVVLSILFPDCWDGVRKDSRDHQRHMAYANPPGLGWSYAKCPPTHPVPIPQLQMRVQYLTHGAPSGVELSSGSIWSGHADFMNGWPQAKLQALVDDCVRRAVDCAN